MNLRNMWREMALLLLCGPLLALLAWDGQLELIDAGIMFTVVVVFFYVLYAASCRDEICAVTEGEQEVVEKAELKGSVPRLLLTLFAGTALLAVGAQTMIEGSTTLARSVGIGEDIIGLTLVALGTTVPELTVTVTSARRGHSDVVLGNAIGSIIINTLFVLGIGAAVAGIETTGPGIWFGIAAMMAISALLAILIAVLNYARRMVGVHDDGPVQLLHRDTDLHERMMIR